MDIEEAKLIVLDHLRRIEAQRRGGQNLQTMKKEQQGNMAIAMKHEEPPTVTLVNIERYGEDQKILLPKDMPIEKAIQVLMRQADYDEEDVEIIEDVPVAPYDAAYSLSLAMKEQFGWPSGEIIPSFFGNILPKIIKVPSGPGGRTVEVPWGRFSLPGISGHIETRFSSQNEDRVIGRFFAKVKRKHEDAVRELFERAKRFLTTSSIYRGKAFRIRFKKANGDVLEMPEINFMDLSTFNPSVMVYNDDVDAAIRTNLFTPIQQMDDLRKHGIPIKRGVLLAGKFGGGKTLAAYACAQYAEAAGITFIYGESANEFTNLVAFAKNYGPAVIFMEDIDKVLSGERNITMDSILNVIDGIDSKGCELITVLTTNTVEKIQRAMLRPGRLDAVIDVQAPDAKSVNRLFRYYAGDTLDPDADLTEACHILAGQMPAIIKECVDRAKLSALRLAGFGAERLILSDAALTESAKTMKLQIDLLTQVEVKELSDVELFGESIGRCMTDGLTHALQTFVEGTEYGDLPGISDGVREVVKGRRLAAVNE